MARKLTDQQIAQRLQEGRNYKRLYVQLKAVFDEVVAEHKQCPKLLAAQQAQLEKQAIQIAELQAMVFGKKKRPPMGGTPIASVPSLFVPEPKQRSKASYRRPVPPASAVTSEAALPLPENCVCGGSFNQSKVTAHDRFVEDIPLPELTPDYQARLVTKFRIERGRCLTCGKATAGQDLGGAQVSLGPNVRLLVIHLVAQVGLSYAQTASLLLGLHSLKVSDGEIANILTKQRQVWLPAYNQLKADIRAAPVRHYDETPWKIQMADNAGYAWVMSAANSANTFFHCASSRGGRHAQKLHGTDSSAATVHVSDDYGAYRNLPGQQQLCWAHLYRTIRDLYYNTNLPKDQAVYVRQWYESFAAIYQDLRQYLTEPYDKVVRTTQATELWQRIQPLANEPAPKAGEPDKLRRLKAQLLRAGQDRLLVCLPKNTPCDNNRAERDLRQLVLKRKRSFGSKTEKGAQALATVLSLCTTTWRSSPDNYFASLAALG